MIQKPSVRLLEKSDSELIITGEMGRKAEQEDLAKPGDVTEMCGGVLPTCRLGYRGN